MLNKLGFSLIGVLCFILSFAYLFVEWSRGDGVDELLESAWMLESVEIKVDKVSGELPEYSFSAQDVLQAYRVLAMIQAYEELVLLEDGRKIIQGEMSASAGNHWRASDRMMRFLDMSSAAEKKLHQADSLAFRVLHAYAEGLNQYIQHSDLPYQYKLHYGKTMPWTAEEILALPELKAFSGSECWKRRLLTQELVHYFGYTRVTELFASLLPRLEVRRQWPDDYLSILENFDGLQQLHRNIIGRPVSRGYRAVFEIDSVFYHFSGGSVNPLIVAEKVRISDRYFESGSGPVEELNFAMESMSATGIEYLEENEWLPVLSREIQGEAIRYTPRGLLLNDLTRRFKYHSNVLVMHWPGGDVMTEVLQDLEFVLKIPQKVQSAGDSLLDPALSLMLSGQHKGDPNDPCGPVDGRMDLFNERIESVDRSLIDSSIFSFFDVTPIPQDLFRSLNKYDMKENVLDLSEKEILLRILFPESKVEKDLSRVMTRKYFDAVAYELFHDDMEAMPDYIRDLFFSDRDMLARSVEMLLNSTHSTWWDDQATPAIIENRDNILLNSYRKLLADLSRHCGSEWQEWDNCLEEQGS